MTVRGALALAGAVVMLATACQARSSPVGGARPAAPGGSPPGGPGVVARQDTAAGAFSPLPGLGPGTAIVTLRRIRSSVTLAAPQTAEALRATQDVLAQAGTLTPVPAGRRLLANLRLNEHLLDVAIWTPQTLSVSGHRFVGVSGILIPFTGAWRNRLIIVHAGEVAASAPLLDSPPLFTLERMVEGMEKARKGDTP